MTRQEYITVLRRYKRVMKTMNPKKVFELIVFIHSLQKTPNKNGENGINGPDRAGPRLPVARKAPAKMPL